MATHSMRITNRREREGGHILLTALVMAVTIAIAVGSFAILASRQNTSISRSMNWNQSIPVAESGIEEAMTQLYYNATNNPPGNGWTVTNGLYFKQRSLGTNGNYYTVTIFPSNTPVVTAVGYTLQPLSKTNYLARTVQVKTAKAPVKQGGVVARGAVNISGGAFIDSFDSSDPNHSTNGLYTSAKRKDNGLLISNSGASGAISISGGGVYGSVATGATGTVTTSGSAKVGDIAYWGSSSGGIEAGHNANNANVDFPPVVPPSTGGTYTPSAATYNGTNYSYYLTSGSYYSSSKMTVSSSGNPMAINGDVTLCISNSLVVSGSGYIYLYPGSRLKLYISGSYTVSGGGVVNGTQNASMLSIYGLGTNAQTWTYSGSAQYIGTVYAPYANFTFSGGQGASGSFTVNTATISGSAGIHYDENLSPGFKGYIVTAWNEL